MNDKDPLYWQAQEKAIAYIEYKLRTEGEVRRKLLQKQYPEEIVEQVMAFLRNYGYVDDAAYCAAYIRDSLRFHPKGPMRLRMELLQKGVAPAVADAALEETPVDEAAEAAKLLGKKVKHGAPSSPQEKQRLANYLRRRGFSYSAVREALSALEESENEQDEFF